METIFVALMILVIFIQFKVDDRSLGVDYEDLDEYGEEELEEVDDHDDLTEYDRSIDFWDNIMGTEEDKRTQVWSLSGFFANTCVQGFCFSNVYFQRFGFNIFKEFVFKIHSFSSIFSTLILQCLKNISFLCCETISNINMF